LWLAFEVLVGDDCISLVDKRFRECKATLQALHGKEHERERKHVASVESSIATKEGGETQKLKNTINDYENMI
jgi:hypothetical protein